jgi:hypothetical protein
VLPPNQGVTLPVRHDGNTQRRRFGYARVSTYGQTCDAQLERLRGGSCTKIYREKGHRRAQRPVRVFSNRSTPSSPASARLTAAPSGCVCPWRCIRLRRHQLRHDCLQGIKPRRVGGTIFVDRRLQEPQQDGVLFIGEVKVHRPDIGLPRFRGQASSRTNVRLPLIPGGAATAGVSGPCCDARDVLQLTEPEPNLRPGGLPSHGLDPPPRRNPSR